MLVIRRYSLAIFALVATAGTAALLHTAPATAASNPVRPLAVARPAVPASLKVAPAAHTAARPKARPAAPHVTTHRAATQPHHRAVAVHRTSTAPVAAVVVTADSYPYAHAVGNAQDAWGFTERQCVSYAAWRLASAGSAISNTDGWGSAYQWDDAARRLGRTVSSTPSVGSIAQWNAGESSLVFVGGSSTPNGRFTAGPYGHVGYVTAVFADGSVMVAQYNLRDDRSFSTMRMHAPRFLRLGR